MGNYTDPKTYLGEIHMTILNTYINAIESFKYIQQNSNKFIENKDSIEQLITEILRKLNNLKFISDKIQTNFTDKWFEIVKNLNLF